VHAADQIILLSRGAKDKDSTATGEAGMTASVIYFVAGKWERNAWRWRKSLFKSPLIPINVSDFDPFLLWEN